MEILSTVQIIITISSTVVGGIIVAIGNFWINKRGLEINAKDVASNAASAVVEDMRKLIGELRTELKRKDIIIESLRTEIKKLRDEIKVLTDDLQLDTERIIRRVEKK